MGRLILQKLRIRMMTSKKFIFDLETNGLLYEVDKVHCMVVKDVETSEVFTYTKGTMEEGLELLSTSTCLIGHNIIKYDLPVLEKLYNFKYTGETIDTLLLAKLLYPGIMEEDIKQKQIPSKLFGRHSLEAWGHRVGENKGDFGKDTDWSEFSPEMLEYCIQDVETNHVVYNKLMEQPTPQPAFRYEQKFAEIIGRQERNGWEFDVEGAKKLHFSLLDEQEELLEQIQNTFKPVCKRGVEFTYKKKNLKKGIMADNTTVCKVSFETFNPGSRQHIAVSLREKYGWKPKVLTETGAPKISEEVLESLDYPEAQILAKLFRLQKILGQLVDGANSWLKLVKDDGRIHGSVDTLGAVTGRCTHNKPNVAQVPSGRAFKGKESRSLFKSKKGYKIVGCDASGLELRTLSHYLARYDGGSYANEVLKGDIHTANQKAAGLPTRDNAKTFIYGFLYGAGAAKIGEIIGKGAKEGNIIKSKFLKKLPAIAKLSEAVVAKVEAGETLKGLDGRTYFTRSSHSALNVLLQGAGAIVMKVYLILLDENLQKLGWNPGEDYEYVGNIHDEVQAEVLESRVEAYKIVAEETFAQVTTELKFRIPLEGEAKSGDTWNETH